MVPDATRLIDLERYPIHRDGAGRDAVSGIYFCVLDQDGSRQTRKMVLVR